MVVFRRSEGRLVPVPLLVVLEEQDAMLSDEDDALIWVADRDGHMEG